MITGDLKVVMQILVAHLCDLSENLLCARNCARYFTEIILYRVSQHSEADTSRTTFVQMVERRCRESRLFVLNHVSSNLWTRN